MDFTDKLDILYARRSSEDGKDGESIENQVALLKQYAADKGYYNIKVVTDDGYTGTNFNRPGFQEAFALIQHRRVGRFIVKDLSRLGRNTIEVGQYIGVIFPRFGVEFISVHDGPESSDPDSLVTQFKNIMNEYYAKDISDKQKLSLQARSNSGRHIASTPTYGYKLDPNDRHHWIIDEPAAEVVRLVFKYYNEGMQVSEIARTLEKAKYPAPSHYRKRVVKGSRTEKNPYHWTGSSVTAILKRQEYAGDTVNFKTYHTNFKDKQVHYRDEENFRQYRTKSVWRLCTPSACKFPVIFHKNAREYIQYSLRFLFHLTKNLTTHLSHNLCAVLPLPLSVIHRKLLSPVRNMKRQRNAENQPNV